MADSDSSLSSPPSTDDEMPVDIPPAAVTKPTSQKKKKNGNILSFFERKSPSPPPRKKRPASPPHEYVPEDNPDIAFIVMFRSRFTEAFPPKCPHLGPQDIERGVEDPVPSPQVEELLRALLGLVLNRKKPVEKGHYGRALEEAVQTQKSQWPRAWNYVNPLSGGRSFNSMVPSERIALLKALVLWSLNQSEVVNAMIKDGYKSRTTKDKLDTHIPLSVQPWGRDGDKRRYWLIEGQNDTSFRVYRESNPQLKNVTWWSVAGSIEELRELAKKLEEEDATKEAKLLSERVLNAIPRFEATEVKRKRREYKINRDRLLAQPGYSLYEGRTRGKRQKYTYSDGEDYESDTLSVRRSTRTSGRETSAMPSGPTVTASGRQVRSRATGMYGESLLSGQTTDRASPATGEYMRSDASEEPQQPTHGRSTRAANRVGAPNGWAKGRKHIETYNDVDSMDEDDATSWDGGDEDEEDDNQMVLDDDEDDFADNSTDEEAEPHSLVVRLRYPKGAFNPPMKSTPIVHADDVSVPDTPIHQHAYPIGAPLSGVGAPRQPEPASIPAPAPAPAPVEPAQSAHQPQHIPTAVPFGVQTQQAQTSLPPLASIGVPAQHEHNTLPPLAAAAQGPPPQGNPTTLPKLDGLFSAPTPPYNASVDAAPKPPQPQFNVSNPESHPPQPFSTTLPTPTSTSSWQ